ncbi:hypothetical protein DET60_103126 [Raoultella planticola]|nr:hypothetical protein DFO76_101921 [Raoultella planticola]TDX38708.1 hypothetical protein DET60_103126 [Raoultella planticola]VTM96421.1 Uncharacterised protein [Raoultella planticola]VTN01061.1 Uncharacterised protein [Raoultella planticola]
MFLSLVQRRKRCDALPGDIWFFLVPYGINIPS